MKKPFLIWEVVTTWSMPILFVNIDLQLPIYEDTSEAAQHVQQSVNGETFKFSSYVYQSLVQLQMPQRENTVFLMKDLGFL